MKKKEAYKIRMAAIEKVSRAGAGINAVTYPLHYVLHAAVESICEVADRIMEECVVVTGADAANSGYISMEPVVWQSLTQDEKAEVRAEKLRKYKDWVERRYGPHSMKKKERAAEYSLRMAVVNELSPDGLVCVQIENAAIDKILLPMSCDDIKKLIDEYAEVACARCNVGGYKEIDMDEWDKNKNKELRRRVRKARIARYRAYVEFTYGASNG